MGKLGSIRGCLQNNAYAVERKDVKVREKVLYAEDIYLSKDVEDERTHFLTQR